MSSVLLSSYFADKEEKKKNELKNRGPEYKGFDYYYEPYKSFGSLGWGKSDCLTASGYSDLSEYGTEYKRFNPNFYGGKRENFSQDQMCSTASQYSSARKYGRDTRSNFERDWTCDKPTGCVSTRTKA